MTMAIPEAPDLTMVDAWWRAANCLAVGQIYLRENPLLAEPLRPGHIKPRLLGHWGTSPGLNLIYAHLNRVIRERGTHALHVTGPGHGGPSALAASWLDGTYSERHPNVSRDAAGMAALFRQFSYPGGVPSHIAPGVPGSIHEGGELGYSLAHAFGAAFDNPGLVVACVIGDGEAETGPLAASWHGNKFLSSRTDGAVLPILHLNGWKIADPTLLARMPREEPDALLTGYGWRPIHVEGDEPAHVHAAFATALVEALDGIAHLKATVRTRPRWPMIVCAPPRAGPARTPWTTHPSRAAGARTKSRWLGPREPGAPGPPRCVDAVLPPRRTLRRGRAAHPDRARQRARRRHPPGRGTRSQRRHPAAGVAAARSARLRRQGHRARRLLLRTHPSPGRIHTRDPR